MALHFDPTVYGDMTDEQLAAKVAEEGKILEDAIGAEVGSVSLHNPTAHGRYPMFAGWRNAYDNAIFGPDRYLSDSCMRFRTDPYEFFRPRQNWIYQFLLHPLHYSEDGAPYPSPQIRHIRQCMGAVDDIFAINESYRHAMGGRRLESIGDGNSAKIEPKDG